MIIMVTLDLTVVYLASKSCFSEIDTLTDNYLSDINMTGYTH